jgi:hypothetical protein
LHTHNHGNNGTKIPYDTSNTGGVSSSYSHNENSPATKHNHHRLQQNSGLNIITQTLKKIKRCLKSKNNLLEGQNWWNDRNFIGHRWTENSNGQ